MIILRSRSLIIPNDEYNLGNDYDTNTATRVFQLDRVMEGIDLANLMFKLDLTYADGTSDTLALDSEVTDDKINLTWTVTKNQLHVPGTVVVQIRALNVDGNMKWTSYIGAFFVEASMFGSADYSGKLTEVEQFEVAIKSEKERVQNEKARQDAEAERVQAEAERKSAEEERKTAEAERKSAETVRSNAETARESAETEREEWYNSAKTNFDAAIASGDKAEEIANSLEANVDANMKAAAASATAAAGSASAAAGSANEAKQYSQNWSALDQRVTKNADDIAATNNNLGNTVNNLSTSILDYALTLEKGLYSVSLSGSSYTGNDLPNTAYVYSSALIDVRVKGKSVTVMLFGISTKQPLAVNSKDSGAWLGWQQYVTKDDLGVFLTASGTKAAVFRNYIEITNLKLYAGHTYLVLGKTGSSTSISLISARIVSPTSEYGSAFNFLESRTIGSSGGGCVTAAIITLTKDYTVPLQGYGYDNATYDYNGSLMAIQLK